MKPNRFKQTFADKNLSVGHMISEFGVRGQAKMLELADVDFVIIDTEHSCFSIADISDQIAWFKATDIAPFVRIPQLEYHFIARTLDVGALGLMVPNVKSGDQAAAVIQAAKYAPIGDRGLGLGSAHTDFGKVDPEAFMAYANENTTIICQIESVEGLNNIDAIATTPGVDVLWVGHFDLSQSMGIPGRFEEKLFLDGLACVVETAKKYGLGAGIQPGNLDLAKTWTSMGFNVISYGSDHTVYLQAMTRAISDLRQLRG